MYYIIRKIPIFIESIFFFLILDRVFDEQTVTLDVFEDICKPIVDSALQGIHGKSLCSVYIRASLRDNMAWRL